METRTIRSPTWTSIAGALATAETGPARKCSRSADAHRIVAFGKNGAPSAEAHPMWSK